jgi:DNA processing protein
MVSASVITIDIPSSPYAPVFAGIMPAVGQLYVASDNLDDLMARPKVAIVGTRKVTPYGRQATAQFTSELARAGIVIVSGLAYGVDAAAHRAALEACGLTIAVLPGSVERPYPAAHRGLAEAIVQGGGALLSEYPSGTTSYKSNFVGRNRIVSGMSDVLLITEAAVNSGTMHTARFALEQGKDVFAVPGNITSPVSEGTNNLLKSGAMPATSAADILHVLGLQPARVRRASSSNSVEQCILDLLGDNVTEGNTILERSRLPADQFAQALTMLEITGKVRALGNNHWAIA